MYALIETFPETFLARKFNDCESLLEFVEVYHAEGQIVSLATLDIIEDLREDGYTVDIVS